MYVMGQEHNFYIWRVYSADYWVFHIELSGFAQSWVYHQQENRTWNPRFSSNRFTTPLAHWCIRKPGILDTSPKLIGRLQVWRGLVFLVISSKTR